MLLQEIRQGGDCAGRRSLIREPYFFCKLHSTANLDFVTAVAVTSGLVIASTGNPNPEPGPCSKSSAEDASWICQLWRGHHPPLLSPSLHESLFSFHVVSEPTRSSLSPQLTTLRTFLSRLQGGGKRRNLSVMWVVAKWVVVLGPGGFSDLWHFATAA